MEKYGFVYLWYDRKHKRYYVGCHWGHENDSYICSSRWMRKALKRRSEDFKRRILKSNIYSRQQMFDEELRYLNMIKKEEISPHTENPRYYNLQLNNGHWTTCNDKLKTISEKISNKTKEAMQRPDVREKYLNGLKTRDMSKNSDPEILEQKRQKMLENMAIKFPHEKRKKTLKKGSEELNEIYKQKSVEMWQNKTEEQKQNILNKLHEANKHNKHIRAAKISATKWYNNGFINTRKTEHPGPGWVLGRI